MSEKEEIQGYVEEVVGQENCGISCEKADIFHDPEGWKMMLEGLSEPWPSRFPK